MWWYLVRVAPACGKPSGWVLWGNSHLISNQYLDGIVSGKPSCPSRVGGCEVAGLEGLGQPGEEARHRRPTRALPWWTTDRKGLASHSLPDNSYHGLPSGNVASAVTETVTLRH